MELLQNHYHLVQTSQKPIVFQWIENGETQVTIAVHLIYPIHLMHLILAYLFPIIIMAETTKIKKEETNDSIRRRKNYAIGHDLGT